MPLTIRLLGPTEISVDGNPLKVDTRKAIAVLAYLAATGSAQSREHLADLLWPDVDEERARATLRRTLSALKTALGDRWLIVERGRVAVARQEDVDVDVAQLADVSQLHDHPAGQSCPLCFERLQGLAALDRGDFMQGFVLRDAPGFEEWQLAENERVRRELASILDRLLDAAVALGHEDDAIDIASRRIEMDPLNEPAYRTTMRLHARRGDRGGVVGAYRTLVAALERELGVEPLDETTDLYRALARGESVAAVTAPEVALVDPGQLPFVGRAREWDRLVTVYQQLGGIVGIEGEPGIGKTRLVEELTSHAEALGARTFSVRSHEGESHVAYGVLTDALRSIVTTRVVKRLSDAAVEELARLLPELDVAPAQSPVASRFYEAVRSTFEQGLRGDRPGVAVFEDVHWADEATLDVLAYVARRAAETGICMVLTWRTGELDDVGLVARLLRDVPSTRIALERFVVEDVTHLVEETGLAADADTGAMVSRLLEETEGVPYFVTEYVKALKSGAGWEVPGTVRDLLVKRLGNARAAAAQILDAAAVIDRAIDFEMVARVSGRTDLETADAIDALSRAGLIRSLGSPDRVRYEFSHEKLRAVAYEEMGPARRHVLHRRVAEALCDTAGALDRDGPLAGTIARHFEVGGAIEDATRFHRLAGAWARRVFAHVEALDHYRRALALGDISAEVHEAIADIHVLQGSYAEAVGGYETAAALADQPHTIDRKLGALHLRRGDYDLAEAHLNDALERSTDDAVMADILVDLSLSARRRGSDEVARRHASEAVERAARVEDLHVRARAENVAGMLASSGGDVAKARSHLEIALEMSERAADLAAMTAALNNLAQAEQRAGNLDTAIELTTQALDVCRRFGDRHREAALENNLADLFNASGDRDRSMEHLKRATAIFAEVGSDPEGLLPEVWKLVDW